MSNRRFEVFEYRQVLVRMRQGDSIRSIARSGLMGRDKLKNVRATALAHNWLEPALPMPDDAEIIRVLGRAPHLPSRCVSTVEPFREQIRGWLAATQPRLYRQLFGGAPHGAPTGRRARRGRHDDPRLGAG
jgi:hypothetical protein